MLEGLLPTPKLRTILSMRMTKSMAFLAGELLIQALPNESIISLGIGVVIMSKKASGTVCMFVTPN